MNLPSPEFDLRAYLLGPSPARNLSIQGSWAVERQLLDRSTGTHGTFAGVVRFSPTDDGGLAFREQGTMRWPTFTGPASREYVLNPLTGPTPWTYFLPTGGPSTG